MIEDDFAVIVRVTDEEGAAGPICEEGAPRIGEEVTASLCAEGAMQELG